MQNVIGGLFDNLIYSTKVALFVSRLYFSSAGGKEPGHERGCYKIVLAIISLIVAVCVITCAMYSVDSSKHVIFSDIASVYGIIYTCI